MEVQVSLVFYRFAGNWSGWRIEMERGPRLLVSLSVPGQTLKKAGPEVVGWDLLSTMLNLNQRRMMNATVA